MHHAACLLHADYHPMTGDCWAAVLDWQNQHHHLSAGEARDDYQAAVERRILNTLTAGSTL